MDGLEDAIDDMYRNFNGELAAVIEDGRATSIIIHNTNKKPVDEGTTTPAVSNYQVIVSDEANDYQDAQIFAPTNAASWSIPQALNALAARIQADGNTLVEIDTTSGGSITWLDASMGDARKVTALPSESGHRLYRVELNGDFQYMLAGETVGNEATTGTNMDWDVAWEGEYFYNASNGYYELSDSSDNNHWYTVTRTNANSNGVITLEDGFYDVTVTVNCFAGASAGIQGQTISNGSNQTVYMQPGKSLTLKVTGGNWDDGTNEYTLTANTGYTISDRTISQTAAGGTYDIITVQLTAPSTLSATTDNTVTIGFTTMS